MHSSSCHPSDDAWFPTIGCSVGAIRKRDEERLHKIKERLPQLHVVVFSSCEIMSYFAENDHFKEFCKEYDSPPHNLRPRKGFYGGMTVTFREKLDSRVDGKIIYIGMEISILNNHYMFNQFVCSDCCSLYPSVLMWREFNLFHF